MISIYKIFQNIKHTPLLLAVCFALILAACAEDGDTGPQGETGDQGTAGSDGEDGEDGDGLIAAIGYFEGTITGTRGDDDVAIDETFKYEYVYTSNKYFSDYNGMALLNLKRLLRPEPDSDYTPYLTINLAFTDPGDGTTVANVSNFYLYFTKGLDPFTLFELYADGDDDIVTISNYALDEETGIVTFDFTYQDTDGDENSTENPLTITGSFNSGQKIYSDVVYKKSK